MAKPLESNRIIAEILAGHHNDQLSELYHAVLKVAASEDLAVRWRIDYDGMEITEDSLTVGECLDIEEETGHSWAAFNPTKTAHMARAIMVAALKRRQGYALNEARERVDAMAAADLLNCVSEYVVDGSPLDQQVTPTGEGAVPFE